MRKKEINKLLKDKKIKELVNKIKRHTKDIDKQKKQFHKTFEKRLKEVFVEYIKQFQEESKTVTREWMSGITFDKAKNIILEENKKFNEQKSI